MFVSSWFGWTNGQMGIFFSKQTGLFNLLFSSLVASTLSSSRVEPDIETIRIPDIRIIFNVGYPVICRISNVGIINQLDIRYPAQPYPLWVVKSLFLFFTNNCVGIISLDKIRK